MSIENELAAIRESAAIYPLTDRGFLRITGPDATRWLNGMVTNSVQSLAPGEGNYNFLLNAQGRIQGDCTIYREPGDGEPSFLVETDKSQVETIHTTLDRFIIMDDVEITSPPSDQKGLLVLGRRAASALASAGLPTTPFSGCRLTASADGGVTILTGGIESGLQLVGDARQIENILSKLKLSKVSPETIEVLRILEGRPKFGIDIRERDLPQETGQTHALHFNKGCYLGQEIVERIRSRGQVHRQFTPLQLTGELPASLPAPLEANGKAVGEVTSAAQVGDDILALGYVRREAFHQQLTYAGGTADIRHTPAIN